jgi:hypothetical protein
VPSSEEDDDGGDDDEDDDVNLWWQISKHLKKKSVMILLGIASYSVVNLPTILSIPVGACKNFHF